MAGDGDPVPADPAGLAELRKCERLECTFKVPNVVTDLNHILQCMSNHLLAMHPVGQSEGGGGAASGKSSAAIPVLSEDCDEIAYAAWLARFERWQLGKPSKKKICFCLVFFNFALPPPLLFFGILRGTFFKT